MKLAARLKRLEEASASRGRGFVVLWNDASADEERRRVADEACRKGIPAANIEVFRVSWLDEEGCSSMAKRNT